MIREQDAVQSGIQYQSAAERAFAQALADFYHPPLPSPIIQYDPEASSFFFIDAKSWTVHLNTAGVPVHLDANEAEPYLRSVSQHEIQHYLVCPFDGITNGMMFAAARRHVNDATAMFTCNLFADLVVDSGLLKRYPRLTHERIQLSIHDSAMRVKEHSPLWLLIAGCYRAMWGFPLPPTAGMDRSTYSTAEAIVEMVKKSLGRESRWPKTCREIARIIAEWLPPEEEQLPGCPALSSDGGLNADSVTIFVPLDVDGIMGSPIEDRNGDRARRCLDPDSIADMDSEMERIAVEVEQRGGGLDDLDAVYTLTGIGDERSEWIRFWYRAKARGMIRYEISERFPSGSVPLTPQLWRLGDPVEELDIVQSLQTFPVLVPNLSTRRWAKADSFGQLESKSIPDMLIVIDSSGSMTYSMSRSTIAGEFHTALLAAFASMDFALKRGRRVAVINFSDGVRVCDWTRQRRDAEMRLLSYQGGGTMAPIKHIEQMCSRADGHNMIILMTDAEIANWDKFVKAVDTLTKKGIKLFLFHIGRSSAKSLDKIQIALKEAGANVYPIASVDDLPGLVVREINSFYRY
ncbi:MAG: VWA domain-containing protein [Candidatus Thorarchaeota archaeon]|nr:MAG: VWA domain-containing protein [Candidatus Thorarchaeota archaeon]